MVYILGNSERISYLDIAKGIAIVLVILGHIYNENPIKIWLYSFHLPLFFFISGCLLSSKNVTNVNMGKIIRDKVRSLIIPYFSFSIIITCLWGIETYLTKRTDLTMGSIENNLISVITFRGIEALWFLPCLFAIEIIFIFFIKHLIHKEIIISTIIIISLLPFVKLSNNIYYLEIVRVFVGLVFLGSGYYLFKSISKIDNIIFPIVFLMINIIIANYNGFVDIYSVTLNNYLLYYVSAFCGIIGILLLCKKIRQIRTIEFIGVNSLIIFATHLQVMAIVFKLLGKITKHSSLYLRDNVLWGIVVLCVVILMEMPVIYIINKWFSFLLGRRKFYKEKEYERDLVLTR